MAAAPARVAVLLGGISGDASVSMRRYARELAGALAIQDAPRWQVELIQPPQGRLLSRLWPHPQVIRLESAVSRYALYPAGLLRARGDLFHVLDHAYGHLVRALDAGRTIVTCHDLIPLLSAEGRIPMVIPDSVVRTVRLRVKEMVRAACILTDSAATRNDLLHFTNVAAAKVVVIAPGVSAVFAAGSAAEVRRLRLRFGLTPETLVVLQVATRGRYKNSPVLLKAFAHLRRRLGPAVVLARIGVPLHDDERELATRLGVLEWIRQLGFVDDATLAEWYRVAAVLAFPSLYEGFGWPPLEAMASGTPVVASRIPAIEEVTAGAAVLVDPHDEIGLAAAIERIVTDPAHASCLRRRGLARAQQLTWGETARRALAVYDEVA